MMKIAVIGLGNIAERHRRNLKLLHPECFIISVSASGRNISTLPANADSFSNNIEDVISEQVDWVIIASPASFHLKHVKPFIKANVSMIIEKPLASSIADGLKMKEYIEKYAYNKTIVVGYCLRFLPTAAIMKSLIDSCKVGEIYNVKIEIGQYLPDWRPNKHYMESVSANKHLGGGALLELSHELDYALWLFGSLKVKHSILRNSNELNLDVEDLVDLVLESPKAEVINVHLDFLQKRATRTCTVIGSKGRLEWNLLDNTILYSESAEQSILYSDKEWDKNLMYLNMVKQFEQSQISVCNSNASFDDALQVLTLIDDIKQGKQ